MNDAATGDMHGRVAIVTGAASGIGLAASAALLARGATVFLLDRDAEGLEAACGSLDSTRAQAIVADVASEGSVKDAISAVCASHGRIDAALLNAGITGTNAPIEDYSVALFDETVATNLRGAWLCLRGVAAKMKEARRGSIVLTSSIQGLAALAGTTAYTTTKHALVGMMKGAALELAPYGVRVNTVHPGYVDTPMMRAIHASASPDDPESFGTALAATVPMGRYAEAGEIASLIGFLLSDEASYSTGSCFVADGGMLAALPALGGQPTPE